MTALTEGLAVALAEKAFAGGLGIEADLANVKMEGKLTDTQILYSETASRIIITVRPKNTEIIESAFGDDISRIGRVTSDKRLKIKGSGGIIIDRQYRRTQDGMERAAQFLTNYGKNN